ncbi:MAG: hypothetical protein ACUVRO_09890 [Armatimonadota bacterium]
MLFVPGQVAAGSNINLPAAAPKIDIVSGAYIVELTSQISKGGLPINA